MRQAAMLATILVLVTACASCESGNNASRQQGVVYVPDFGLRYAPPTGMVDRTPATGREAREHAAAYDGSAFNILLEMSSKDTDKDRDWHRLLVVAYPRSRWANLTDRDAQLRINRALAGSSATAVGEPSNVTLSAHKFIVSEFELKEPPLLKHAKVFTTICKGQLV
jgi:hypothetical protein